MVRACPLRSTTTARRHRRRRQATAVGVVVHRRLGPHLGEPRLILVGQDRDDPRGFRRALGEPRRTAFAPADPDRGDRATGRLRSRTRAQARIRPSDPTPRGRDRRDSKLAGRMARHPRGDARQNRAVTPLGQTVRARARRRRGGHRTSQAIREEPVLPLRRDERASEHSRGLGSTPGGDPGASRDDRLRNRRRLSGRAFAARESVAPDRPAPRSRWRRRCRSAHRR
jgi:hypothetical protein